VPRPPIAGVIRAKRKRKREGEKGIGGERKRVKMRTKVIRS